MVVFVSFVISVLLLLNWTSVNDAQEVEKRIVGGNEASPGEFPFIVSIQLNGSHFGAGSILTTTWILTSAYTVSSTSELANYQVLAGTTTLDAGGARRNISQIVIHPQYVDTETYDIALVRIDRPFQLCSRVQPVNLTNVDTAGDTYVIVAGWGTVSYAPNVSSVYSNHLLRLNSRTISNENCTNMTGYNVSSMNLCAFTMVGEGACVGDVGDPLIDTTTRQVVGILSSIYPCATGMPDFYTRVFSYLDWIASNMS